MILQSFRKIRGVRKFLSSSERSIKDVLHFRTDISPFFVHLTRDYNRRTARRNLQSILKCKQLKYGHSDFPISAAYYRCSEKIMDTVRKEEDGIARYFSAVCFTETPLAQIHSLLNIARRNVRLKPYGLVFIRERCEKRGVSPVLYFNNSRKDKNEVISSLCSLIQTHSDQAHKILPLVSFFGKHLRSLRNGQVYRPIPYDFKWEREWRYVSKFKRFKFDESEVFIGLCPHDRIEEFEEEFDWLKFIDPTRNLRYYATKLIEAAQNAEIEDSVVANLL